MMDSNVHRREFVSALTAGAAGWLVLGSGASARGYRANEKLNVALVGVGSRGNGLAGQVARIGENLVALCDVDRRRAAPWSERAPEVPWYDDFRVMLDEMDGQIDAVVAALPHHAHAPVAAAAMRRGKHVFIEKPIAHSVAEARALRRIAREQKVATQMGNQGMATNSFRRTVERVWEGAIGEVREAHVWFVFGGPGPRQPPADSRPVPDYLNWGVWLGPAPARPYHPAWMGASATSQCSKWREFSAASLGGSGTHGINTAFMSLRLGDLWDAKGPAGANIRVEAEVSELTSVSYPHWEKVRFDLPARGALPPVGLHWYNAPVAELRRQGVRQRLESIAGRPPVWEGSWTPESGSLVVGSRGVVHSNSHNSINALLPEEAFPDPLGPPQTMPSVRGHLPEWIDACRGGPAPLSNFDYSGPVMELLLLGNVATMFPAALEYDPRAGRIVNHEEANAALARREVREGWELNGPATRPKT